MLGGERKRRVIDSLLYFTSAVCFICGVLAGHYAPPPLEMNPALLVLS